MNTKDLKTDYDIKYTNERMFPEINIDLHM